MGLEMQNSAAELKLRAERRAGEMLASRSPTTFVPPVKVAALYLSDITVVIRDDRITALGKTGEVSVSDSAEVVDAASKFLIPGLWDMHVHAVREGTMNHFLPLFIAIHMTTMTEFITGPSVGVNKILRGTDSRLGRGSIQTEALDQFWD